MQAAIEFSHVTKQYRQKRAVDDVSFELGHGQVVALLGPNGAGKTTAISMMLGLRVPTSGKVRLLGRDPAVPANRRQIGAMLQQVAMPQKTTVRELIALFRSYYPQSLPAARLLEMSGLSADAKTDVSKLSGGQARRLQFALAMAGDPQVLFLDEPTTGMDVQSRRGFWDILKSFASETGRTVILTTHHLEEADTIADRILVIRDGRVVADGSTAALKAMTGDSFVTFRLEADSAREALRSLHGIAAIEYSGRQVRLRTKRADDLVRQLVHAGVPFVNIQVNSGGLEDAFVALTGEEEQTTATAKGVN